jgi:hypothetical protein
MGIFLVLSLLSAGFLVNCQSPPPPPPPSPPDPSLRILTKKILDRAYNQYHLDPKKFQYFLSETIEMERSWNTTTLRLNTKGELLQEDSQMYEKIILEKETKGVTVDIRIDKDYKHWEIDIRFNPNDDRILTFRENDEGSGFDLFYVQTKTGKKIPYGKEEYNLNFTETPQLLIRMIGSSRNQPVVTTAEGVPADSLSSPPAR